MIRTTQGNIRQSRILVALLALAFFMAGGLQASISEPDHILYGQVSWFGEPVPDGELTLHITGDDRPVARYVLNSDPALGSQYALRIPMYSNGERTAGTARTGDEAVIFLDQEMLALVEIGEHGTALRMDLDPVNLQDLKALSINDIQVAEGGEGETTTAEFSVSISEPLEEAVSFSWGTRNGDGENAAIGGSSCGSGADYIEAFGSGHIAAGNVETGIEVQVCGNDEPDGNRHFYVELSNLSDNVSPFKTLGEAVIIDNDTLPQLHVEDISVVEPPVGQSRQAYLRVSLSAQWDNAVKVDWATGDGTASAGLDYVADSGTLSFAPGQQSASIPVTVLANASAQGTRQFHVDLSNPVEATLARSRGHALILDSAQTLVHVETHKNGVDVDNMSDPSDVAVASPDGGHVYVASRTADELVVFDRNGHSGRLGALQTLSVTAALPNLAAAHAIDGISGFSALAVAADGAHVYAVAEADDAIVIFDRDNDENSGNYGKLEVSQVLFDGDNPEPSLAQPVAGLKGPRDLAISSDGLNLYVAASGESGHVVVFSRDPANGSLLFRQALTRGEPDPLNEEVKGIAGASSLALSGDDGQLYVAGQSDNAVVVFERNSGDNGRLSYRRRHVNGLGGYSGFSAPSSLRLSPDSRHVYVAGRDSNSLAVLARDSGGALSMHQNLAAGGSGVIAGLEAPLSLAVSHDGELVYVASAQDGTAGEPGTLATLRRETDQSSEAFGKLTMEEVKRNGEGGVSGLWGATGVAVSPDDAHIYVAARYDQAVSVFARDLLAPVNPAISSATHPVEAWSRLPEISIEWSGAKDLDPGGLESGSGVAGYSVIFSQDAQAEPDESIDVAHGEDPHSLLSEPLADGVEHWFHLRTCDNAGNCSETESYGPMWIDATPPVGPFDVESTSHDPGAPAIPDGIIDIVWTAADDLGDAPSGLDGYSYVFNRSPDGAPDYTVDLDASATGVSSGLLDDGLWWFHIRAIDRAGNSGDVKTIGPFGVGEDSTYPTVQEVLPVSSQDNIALTPGAEVTAAITQLVVGFDKPMEPQSAGDPDNFRLFSGTVDPAAVSCSGSDDGLLGGVTYVGANNQAALRVSDDTGLPAGDYTLVACDSLEDFNGNGLDGDGSGAPGGHFSLPFTVAWTNLLPNPNFDHALAVDNWGANTDQIVHSPDDDIAGIATSGAARIDVAENDPTEYALTRCINLDTGMQAGFVLQARSRIDDPMSSPDPFKVTTSMTFYNDLGCSDRMHGFISNAVIEDTDEAWAPLSVSVSPGAVSGAGSVLVSLDLSFSAGSAFPLTAWFDNVSFFAFGQGDLPNEPPQVSKVLTTHAGEYDDLSAPLPTEAAITQLIVEFSRGVSTTPDGTDSSAANNIDNYRLFDVSDGSEPDCSQQTNDITLSSQIAYQAASKQAVVSIAGNQSLPAGVYRLAVCGDIKDFDDNRLDGAGDGSQGSDYTIDFEVAATNLLRNPNLDNTGGQWQLDVPSGAGQLRWSAADADGRSSSGSLRVQHPGGGTTIYRASQCVDVSGYSGLISLGAHVLVNQADGDAPEVAALASFYDQPGCAGSANGESIEVVRQVPHSAGSWSPLFKRLPEQPSGSVSALVEFEVEAQGGAPVDVWLDRLLLRSGAADVIFRNRFTEEIY